MLISYALPFSGRDSLKKPFLSGRKAIVTGSTAGVGLAIARALVRAGAQVVVNGRKADAVERAVASLSAEPGAAAVHGVVCDVGTAAGCTALIDAHPAADILVNNVGVYGVKDFFEIDDAEWQRAMEAIRDSIQSTGTATYVRVYQRIAWRKSASRWNRMRPSVRGRACSSTSISLNQRKTRQDGTRGVDST